MKYCPKCGTQLPDEAKFCSKCGEKQPGFDNNPTPVPTPTPTPVNTSTNQESNSELYQRLIKDDPKFKAIMKATTLKWLGSISNVLLLITLIVYLAVPYLIFTGVDIDAGGEAFLNALYGGTGFPYSANHMQVAQAYIYVDAINKAFSPSSSMDATIYATTYIFLVFGIVISAVIILVALLNGLRKSYRLEEYKKNEGVQLYKDLKSKPSWVIGAGVNIVFVATSIFQYFGWKDLEYKDHYYFGIIMPDKSHFIACIIVGVIVMGLTIGACVTTQVLATKMAKEYYEK